MSIVKFNPLNDITSLQNEMSRMLENFFPSRNPAAATDSGVWRPAVDIHETEDAYTIDVELPGLKKDEVSLNYQDGTLAISGERKQESESHQKNSHRIERFYGKFYRSFSFPTAVDGDRIQASFSDGVLKVSVPKAEEVKPRRIEIA